MAPQKKVPEKSHRAANQIDRYVGGRIRERRLELRMSQELLAEQLGITFQQVQKYEKGVNRVSASTLFQIINVLDLPMTSLFPKAEDGGRSSNPPPPDNLDLRLITANLNEEGRRLLLDFAQTLSKSKRLSRKT